MRPSVLVVIFVAVVGAIAVGWIYQSKSKTTTQRPELEIPTDIDYFLAELNYRIFNQAGSLDYQLQSPYLEHFTRDDVSRVRQPVVEVYRATGDWRIKASRGEIFHQQNYLKLSKNVVMQKLGSRPIQVRSQSMLFEPDRNLLTSEETVVIESGSARISGDQAVFDLQNEVYSLKNTRSVFYHES
jgi:LPS export ABC transporter protein LptC